MTSGTVILLTAVLCAAACSLLGTFLVLRRMAMMTDAVSHAILPGLVFGYWISADSNLVTGTIGATIAALATVTFVEALSRSGRVDTSAAMGIVFPAMFALGTVLVSRFFTHVHLDADAILMGNIEFSIFDRLVIGDRDLGPRPLWIMGILLLVNAIFLLLFFKELKLSTFDPALAAALGFSPVLIQYALMTVLSVTTVGAFTAVGAILVVALVVVPAATAYLLTDDLLAMISLSVAIGALSAWTGFELAFRFDLSVSGAMATMTGVCFLLALLLSPSQGLIARIRRRRRNARRFAIDLMIAHLLTHEATGAQGPESSIGHVAAALRWSSAEATATIRRARDRGLVEQRADRLALTAEGRRTAETLSLR
ncbi:MAG: metal ABC transporter permease [Thermomicrobiales bacterium]